MQTIARKRRSAAVWEGTVAQMGWSKIPNITLGARSSAGRVKCSASGTIHDNPSLNIAKCHRNAQSRFAVIFMASFTIWWSCSRLVAQILTPTIFSWVWLPQCSANVVLTNSRRLCWSWLLLSWDCHFTRSFENSLPFTHNYPSRKSRISSNHPGVRLLRRMPTQIWKCQCLEILHRLIRLSPTHCINWESNLLSPWRIITKYRYPR